MMTIDQALVEKNTSLESGDLSPLWPKRDQGRALQGEVRPLTDEIVDELLAGRGLRGWLRASQVARVLGLFSLYMFLDTYDVRADFNRRAVARGREVARERGRSAQLRAWLVAQLYVVFDHLMRVLRYFVFRGAEGSAKKEARLKKQ